MELTIHGFIPILYFHIENYYYCDNKLHQKISIHLEIALFYPKTLDNINSFIIEVIINKVFIILLGGSLALFWQYGFNSILNIIP